MKTTKIISAFPACGKSYFYNKHSIYANQGGKRKILDSDSSEFSWVKDENGENTKERNPNFPQNYIDHIKENIGKQDVIFVSSHDVVRNALKENEIEYTLVYPKREFKDEWKQRFINRGNNEGFINFIMSNWDNFINEIENETFPTKYSLYGDRFIDDFIARPESDYEICTCCEFRMIVKHTEGVHELFTKNNGICPYCGVKQ